MGRNVTDSDGTTPKSPSDMQGHCLTKGKRHNGDDLDGTGQAGVVVRLQG